MNTFGRLAARLVRKLADPWPPGRTERHLSGRSGTRARSAAMSAPDLRASAVGREIRQCR